MYQEKKKVLLFAIRILIEINLTISISERLKGNNTDKSLSGNINTVYNKMQTGIYTVKTTLISYFHFRR